MVCLAALMAGAPACLTGCVGYVDSGYGGDYGDYGGYDGFYGGGSDVYLFGDGYGGRRDAQNYSHRGAWSRGIAQSRGFGGRAGSGHGGGGRGGGGGGHGGGGGRH
jgi:hypothetical protein